MPTREVCEIRFSWHPCTEKSKGRACFFSIDMNGENAPNGICFPARTAGPPRRKTSRGKPHTLRCGARDDNVGKFTVLNEQEQRCCRYARFSARLNEPRSFMIFSCSSVMA